MAKARVAESNIASSGGALSCSACGRGEDGLTTLEWLLVVAAERVSRLYWSLAISAMAAMMAGAAGTHDHRVVHDPPIPDLELDDGHSL